MKLRSPGRAGGRPRPAGVLGDAEAEQAGGAASTGYERIMDIIPKELHQRTPLILGNKDVVEETVSVISGG